MTALADYPFDRPSVLGLAPEYDRIQRGSGVALVRMPTGDQAYLVTRYDDVKTVLSDPRFSRAATLKPDAPRLAPARQNFPSLLNMDPPDHTRVRKIISREFTARRVAGLRPRIVEHTERLVEQMAAHGSPVDLMTALAAPLPVTVICELLGVPLADQEKFGQWSRVFLVTTSRDFTKQQILEAQGNLRQYLADLVAQKRQNPGDDLLSSLVSAHDDAGRLTEEELLFLGITLLVAGHETTVNMITNGMLALLLHPDQLAKLQARPELIPGAVEEMLRLFGPGTEALLRIAVEPVELSGVEIPAGSAVLPGISVGNQDAEQFDDPTTFDVERAGSAHLTFGHGPHFCIGSALARVELQICFETLLRRFPDIRLAVAESEVQRPVGLLVNGISSLPVAW